MIKLIKHALSALSRIYKSTFNATIRVFKALKVNLHRQHEINHLKSMLNKIEVYRDKSFFYYSMVHDNQCDSKKAAKFIKQAKKYDKRAFDLNAIFKVEYDKYNKKYYGGEFEQ